MAGPRRFEGGERGAEPPDPGAAGGRRLCAGCADGGARCARREMLRRAVGRGIAASARWVPLFWNEITASSPHAHRSGQQGGRQPQARHFWHRAAPVVTT